MKNKLLLTTALVLTFASQINAETPYRTQKLTFNQQTEQAVVNLLSGQANHFNISNQTVKTYVYHLSDGEIIALAQTNPQLIQALNQLELAESAEFVSRVLTQAPTKKNIEHRDNRDPSFIVTADTTITVQPTTTATPFSPEPHSNEPSAPALAKPQAEAKIGVQVKTQAQPKAVTKAVDTEAQTVTIALDRLDAVDREMTKAINQYNAALESGAGTQVIDAALNKYNAASQKMTKATDQYNDAIEAKKTTDALNQPRASEKNEKNNNNQPPAIKNGTSISQPKESININTDTSNSAKVESQNGYSDIDHTNDTGSKGTNISNATNVSNSSEHNVNIGDYSGGDSIAIGSSGTISNADSNEVERGDSAPGSITEGSNNSGLGSVGNNAVGVAIGSGAVIGIGVDAAGSSNGLNSVGSVAVGVSVGGTAVGTTDGSNSNELSPTDSSELQ